MPTVHDIAIEAQERLLAELEATIATKAATLAAIEERTIEAARRGEEAQSRLSLAGAEFRAKTAEAEQHYTEAFTRARETYETKVALFEQAIGQLSAQRTSLAGEVTRLTTAVQALARAKAALE